MLVDFHNHSCLSPCGSLELSPRRLVQDAAAMGIGAIALTDHNACRNGPAFETACQRAGILPLFGLEITTSEECHVLALFDTLDAALDMDQWIWDSLPDRPLDPAFHMDQPVVDADDTILHMEEDVLLTSASSYALHTIEKKTHACGGLFIPAHINRMAFSVESQLGFLPPGNYDAIEVLPPAVEAYRAKYPHIPVITGSDAHVPEQIGQRAFSLPMTNTRPSHMRQALQTLLP